MVNPAFCQFTNYRSVRFNLDSFALPVVVTKKKNTIYANYLSGLKGSKHQLLSMDEPLPSYGYDHVTTWNNYVFASNQDGLYYANCYQLKFESLNELVFPKQLLVVFNRLFMISEHQNRIYYSVDLRNTWANGAFMDSAVYIPDNYGLCLAIRHYQGRILAICENGLLTINRNFLLEHLADDSDILKNNLSDSGDNRWESDWFSLGYATNTQTLREVFLKTNVNLVLTAISNCAQRKIQVKGSEHVQKLKVNLKGDQFKLTLNFEQGVDNVVVSNLAGVVAYGKRG